LNVEGGVDDWESKKLKREDEKESMIYIMQKCKKKK